MGHPWLFLLGVGSLIVKSSLFGVDIGAPDFWKLPHLLWNQNGRIPHVRTPKIIETPNLCLKKQVTLEASSPKKLLIKDHLARRPRFSGQSVGLGLCARRGKSLSARLRPWSSCRCSTKSSSAIAGSAKRLCASHVPYWAGLRWGAQVVGCRLDGVQWHFAARYYEQEEAALLAELLVMLERFPAKPSCRKSEATVAHKAAHN